MFFMKQIFTYFYLSPLLLILYCAGIGGDQIGGNEDFKERFETTLKSKLLTCNILDSSLSNYSILLTKNSSTNPLSFLGPSSYYTQKDIDFCLKSLISTPCGSNIQEFLLNHTLNTLMFCRPDKACLFDKNHFGQGMWCMR
ncbi:hypothetical protein A0128_13900 [Leptospira tipperaryensis]|uniref:Uncharacterized protein n=1 Tax=Leptospira tipperaryensis TaxID=2564040 RepID=A0A1D7UZ37_9LEPT|nr:hypothetical protein A0128_13900 [Leptospira tipperaryensis]